MTDICNTNPTSGCSENKTSVTIKIMGSKLDIQFDSLEASLEALKLALSDCCEETGTDLALISTKLSTIIENNLDCCELINGKLNELYDVIDAIDVCTTTTTTSVPRYPLLVRHAATLAGACNGAVALVYSSVPVPGAGDILYSDYAMTTAWTANPYVIFSPYTGNVWVVAIVDTPDYDTGELILQTAVYCTTTTTTAAPTTTTTTAAAPTTTTTTCDGCTTTTTTAAPTTTTTTAAPGVCYTVTLESQYLTENGKLLNIYRQLPGGVAEVVSYLAIPGEIFGELYYRMYICSVDGLNFGYGTDPTKTITSLTAESGGDCYADAQCFTTTTTTTAAPATTTTTACVTSYGVPTTSEVTLTLVTASSAPYHNINDYLFVYITPDRSDIADETGYSLYYQITRTRGGVTSILITDSFDGDCYNNQLKSAAPQIPAVEACDEYQIEIFNSMPT